MMDKIGDILSGKDPKSALMRGVRASLVVEYFNQLLVEKWGQAIADEARGLHVKKKTLTIACMSGAVASEIKLSELSLLESINKKFGKETVTKFKIML